MKILHLAIIAIMIVLLPLNFVSGQNQTNSTIPVPQNAIRIPSGGRVTPLQNTENGTELTIHYEKGVDVSGKIMPPPVTENVTMSKHPAHVAPLHNLPLMQLKQGVLAKNVQCNDGLVLVIKAEDGFPACVKPDNAQILIERGWAKKLVQPVTFTSRFTCNGDLVPTGDPRKNIFPVLIMSPNSTAIVCVTYNFETDWQSYHNKDLYPHGILDPSRYVHPGWYSTPLLSDKFEVVSSPPLVNITGVTNGSKIHVTYKIYAKPDSGGFYDTSVPFDKCLSYPLAVGYDQSTVDATKFHNNFDIPCFASIEDVYSVNIVSGMSYKEVQFP